MVAATPGEPLTARRTRIIQLTPTSIEADTTSTRRSIRVIEDQVSRGLAGRCGRWNASGSNVSSASRHPLHPGTRVPRRVHAQRVRVARTVARAAWWLSTCLAAGTSRDISNDTLVLGASISPGGLLAVPAYLYSTLQRGVTSGYQFLASWEACVEVYYAGCGALFRPRCWDDNAWKSQEAGRLIEPVHAASITLERPSCLLWLLGDSWNWPVRRRYGGGRVESVFGAGRCVAVW